MKTNCGCIAWPTPQQSSWEGSYKVIGQFNNVVCSIHWHPRPNMIEMKLTHQLGWTSLGWEQYHGNEALPSLWNTLVLSGMFRKPMSWQGTPRADVNILKLSLWMRDLKQCRQWVSEGSVQCSAVQRSRVEFSKVWNSIEEIEWSDISVVIGWMVLLWSNRWTENCYHECGYGHWLLMTPSIATKFQYVNSLLFALSLTTCFGPFRWDIQLDIFKDYFWYNKGVNVLKLCCNWRES
jgi:hypothetical protein